MAEQYQQLVKEQILHGEGFVRAIFSGRRRGYDVPWRRVILRPVLIRSSRRLQFSYLDEKKDVTKNYAGSEAEEKLEELLALPFRDIHVQTVEGQIEIRVARKGHALIRRSHGASVQPEVSLAHDRQKNLLLPADEPDPFLVSMGIMNLEGKVRPKKWSKFRQINEFLRLVVDAGAAELDGLPLTIVDCGCGNAYLTLALYHYFNHVLGKQANLTGIDVNVELIARHAKQGRDLGWEGLEFQVARIVDFQPRVPPDLVIALHACDTATDEALAQAVRWGARMVFVAPCCHHHLQQQMDHGSAPAPLGPIYQHGILKERLGDILTDTFRALLLQIMGYRVDVIEFVSAEHTDKNLMIRAAKSAQPGYPAPVDAYRQLRQFVQVTPYLEELLRPELSAFL
jgi:SAM-dependent methyltransferase